MASCIWCFLERATAKRLYANQPRECPACGHTFKGNGWDGVDAHWKSKHVGLMSYADFWEGIIRCERGHHTPRVDAN